MPARRAVYAFRDARPMWGGVIWSRAYNSESDTVEIGACEFWSYFDHRNYSGAESESTLAGHAQADQQAARMPVVLPTIEVRGDIPPTAADINRGDDGLLVVPRIGSTATGSKVRCT